jgi:hypothetical protein
MLPLYTLTVDITAWDIPGGEEEFRELISPCLTYLDALRGAFGREPCDGKFYPPDHSGNGSRVWSIQCKLMISAGKKRFELPGNFDVCAEASKLSFS